EMKRDYILDLIAMGLPVERIAEKTHSSTRIVNLLGAKYSQQVAANTSDIVKVLRAGAMKAAFYANEKMPGAKLGELGVFMGISLQRASEMELIAAGTADLKDGAIDVEADDGELRKFREGLRRLSGAGEPPVAIAASDAAAGATV